VWRAHANEKEQVQGACPKETQSAMGVKVCTEEQGGEAREDHEGQDYEGRREQGGGEGRTVPA
jgi:hypothetical protein